MKLLKVLEDVVYSVWMKFQMRSIDYIEIRDHSSLIWKIVVDQTTRVRVGYGAIQWRQIGQIRDFSVTALTMIIQQTVYNPKKI